MRSIGSKALGVGARYAAIAAVALSLIGCSGLRDQLGLGKNSPDEFNVVTRAPLSIPPDFNLRPPDPGIARPQEDTAQELVKAALFAANPGTGGGDTTAGELAVLARAGVAASSPGIRRIIDEENAIYAEENDGFVDQLIFWQENPPPGTLVDPAKENQRLQEAEALGTPVNQGETPIIERRKKGILEGIF